MKSVKQYFLDFSIDSHNCTCICERCKNGKETLLLDSDIKQIQIDALKWANEQIIIDGNPEIAKEKILNKINKLVVD